MEYKNYIINIFFQGDRKFSLKIQTTNIEEEIKDILSKEMAHFNIDNNTYIINTKNIDIIQCSELKAPFKKENKVNE